MPCLRISTNVPLDRKKIDEIQCALTQRIVEILSKPEDSVMVIVEAGKSLFFAGTDEPAAFLELKSIGLNPDQADSLSPVLCGLVEEMGGVDRKRIYIEFTNAEGAFWGWNSRTF